MVHPWRRGLHRQQVYVHQRGERLQEALQLTISKAKNFKKPSRPENTYVDNLMKTGEEEQELKKFKIEATSILESARFPVHKWESDVETLESEDSTNPSKILGITWDKRDDTLEVQVPEPSDNQLLTKRGILSHLASIYDPLGMISPATVKGKQIYRDACDETKGWNADISDQLKRDGIKWSSQLKPVRIPRSVMRGVGRIKAIHLHVFTDHVLQ